MFESVEAESLRSRLRAAAAPPAAALFLALVYFTIYPALGRVPPALFWTVVAILLAGTLGGAVFIVRVVRADRPRGGDIAWLVLALLVELACARLFLGLVFPWF